MTLTVKSSVVAQALVDLIEVNHKPADVAQVYYGEQGRIPDIPTVSVIPGNKDRDYNQTGIQYEVELTTVLFLYHSAVDDLQNTTKNNDELAELLETTINNARKLPDSTGSPQVITGFITRVEPGFASRGKALFVAHRMTHIARSRHIVT